VVPERLVSESPGYMYDKLLTLELLNQVEEALQRIERRFSGILSPDDFLSSDTGIDRLDAIAMMLIAIGENIKRVDKITQGQLLEQYPEIHWPGVKGVRDILAHDYFNIDAEEIYNICRNDLQPLQQVLQKMRAKIQ
jgi:uncharacterized protein with HEPN domain